MSGLFYGLTRLAGKVVEEVVTAPQQIVEGAMDAMDEALDGDL
jgi:hypothetical protein